ncbi:MAG: putative photosynthetic complex assembly protein PuhC [Rhodobacteraceae bacterium]|jgi:putative photosynthetic complex assembly protein|nr:putative photosynthetic complex assembly protein PuhC [Paracoccaceae bacterium]
MKHLSYDRERVFDTRQDQMIPRRLLLAMGLLALSALALASYASLTNRPLEGVPAAAAVIRERALILQGNSAQAVTVLDANGKVLADMAHGGFVTVVQNAVTTARRRQGVDQALPVRLVEYANGRLVLEDPASGESFELYAFGSDNKAAFERLFDK